MLTGLRSKDNCYCENAREATDDKVCHKASNDVLELWHKRLGHMNFRDLLKPHERIAGASKKAHVKDVNRESRPEVLINLSSAFPPSVIPWSCCTWIW